MSKEQEVEGKKYSENTHLVAVIRNKSFLKECLNEIELILKLINGIKSSTGISEEYVHYIDEYNGRVSQKKKIDDKERDVMFNLTKKIVMDKDKAPNCLLIRYFLDVFLDKSASKLDFQKIYAVSTATLFFSLFETKKDLEIILLSLILLYGIKKRERRKRKVEFVIFWYLLIIYKSKLNFRYLSRHLQKQLEFMF